MDTPPPESHDSSPPPTAPSEERAAAAPASETPPERARTREAAPAGDSTAAPSVAREKGDPDWSEPEPASRAGGGNGKAAPVWAATVPSSPGEPIHERQRPAAGPEPHGVEPKGPEAAAEPKHAAAAEDVWADSIAGEPPVDAEITPAPISEPPRAVAADALKSTWPPRGEASPAPPVETDIWPPEPPTERAMQAWPPPSELDEPVTPAQAIPSWPDSFGPAAGSTSPHAQPQAMPEASRADTAQPASGSRSEPPAPAPAVDASPPAPTVRPEPPARPAPLAAPKPGPVSAAEPQPPAAAPVTEPPAIHVDTTPPTEPETIPPAEPEATAPAAPAQAGAPGRPAWAPSATTSNLPAAPAAARQPTASDFQVPAWAPRVPLAAEPGTPTWFSPKEQIPHATAQPMAHTEAPQPPPAPAPPVVGGQLPVAQIPAAPATAAPGQASSAKPTWQVVEQARPAKAASGPTAEDRSYAEWFAWAKRGGAPASACHAAAQGAFKALSSGKDVSTAVQWATAAMSRPPENVTYGRQTYCAWFALANIDLNLDQHRSHSFAGAAVQALDNGADAGAAHAAGLAAAGIK